MSNPTTQFLTGGIDLSSIFQPLSLGTAYPTATGYKIPNGQDLNQIFAAYPGSGTKANLTGYQVGGNDLCNIFAKYNPILYSITNLSSVKYTPIINNGNTGLIFEYTNYPSSNKSTGSCNIVFSTSIKVNFIVVGGGGGGGGGNIYECGGGGGGGGGIINDSFTFSANQTLTIYVGSGGIGCQNSNGGNGNSSGHSGADSKLIYSTYSFIGVGGGSGAGIGTTSGYSGGIGGNASNNINNTGGGGGGSGGGASKSSNNTSSSIINAGPIGYLNSSFNEGNKGTNGGIINNTQDVSGGTGGAGHYSNISLPFTNPITNVYCGNAGGGGGFKYGGNPGYTIGGSGSNQLSTNGGNALYGINNNLYYYGNGGGGGANEYNPSNIGGSGGNGVVILWF